MALKASPLPVPRRTEIYHGNKFISQGLSLLFFLVNTFLRKISRINV